MLLWCGPGGALARDGVWTRLGLEGECVFDLAIAPSGPQVLYAGAFGSGVFRSTDGGASWTGASAGLTDRKVQAVAVDPSDPQVVYAGTREVGVFKTTDGGGSWRQVTPSHGWVEPGQGYNEVTALAIDPVNPQVVYAASMLHWAFKTTDGGESWAAANAGLEGDMWALAIDPVDTQVVYAGARVGCWVFKSTDGGANWTQTVSGLPPDSAYVNAVAIDPSNRQVIYAATSPPAVYKSLDGGGSWTRVTPHMAGSGAQSLAIDPSSAQIVYFGTDEFWGVGAGVLRSTDGGGSWTPTGLENLQVSALAVAPTHPPVAYAGICAGGVYALLGSPNRPPVAHAGPDGTVAVGAICPLDGSGSTDEDGDPLTYRWAWVSKPAGSAATLFATDVSSPTFVPDVPGGYTLQLTVSDGAADSLPDQVVVVALPRVAAPSFWPWANTYPGSVTVSLACATPGATIRYTADGGEPNEGSPAYSAPILLTSSATIRARAYLAGWAPSAVVLSTYYVQPKVATPLFATGQGTYTTSVAVTITCATPGATIRYTLDGSDPTASSAVYSGPVLLTSSAWFKAGGFRSGWADSDVATAWYGTKVATPLFATAQGTYATSVAVTITCATPGATIRYTLDGSDPTDSSAVYSGPVLLTSSAWFKAQGLRSGWVDSEVATAWYGVQQQVAAPTLSPLAGTYLHAVTLALGCATPEALIHYTVDGSDPDDTAPVYSAPLLLSSRVTVKARGSRPGWTASEVATGQYLVVEGVELTACGPEGNCDSLPPRDCARLRAGYSDGATDGVDGSLGEAELPPVPPGAFDVRFVAAGIQGLWVSLRPGGTAGSEWQVALQAGAGGYPLRLEWDAATLPAGGWTLASVDGAQHLIVGMGAASQAVITDPTVTRLRLVHTRPSAYQYPAGWNLVSVPTVALDNTLAGLFPDAISAYVHQGAGFQRADRLHPCTGYWVKLAVGGAYWFAGEPVSECQPSLAAGWSVIGVPSGGVAAADIGQAPADNIISVFAYDHGYQLAAQLDAGMGYWVELEQSGLLWLVGGQTAGAGRLTSAGAEGADGTLQVLSGPWQQSIALGVSASQVRSLPPLPPAGAFDARVMVEGKGTWWVPGGNSAEAYPLLLQGGAEELRWAVSAASAHQWLLQIGATRVELVGTGSVAPSAGSTILLMRHAAAPTEFAVDANYPNPFNPSTTVAYQLPGAAPVELRVYDLTGQLVRAVHLGVQGRGQHQAVWDGCGSYGQPLASGVYLYELRAGADRATGRMVRLR